MDHFDIPDSIPEALRTVLLQKLPAIEAQLKLHITHRGSKILYDGNSEGKKAFRKFLNQQFQNPTSNAAVNAESIDLALNALYYDPESLTGHDFEKPLTLKVNGKSVSPKTVNQKKYLQAVFDHDLVFALGPAGCGKTYLAISLALYHLLNRNVERIVLTRPVVEAGENLGFLPGDIQEKVNPYFRPLYDALYDLIGVEKTAELIEKNIIEIAPLAYMRGRTINHSFIILDEGQNTLRSQMKMFLTRFGQSSKVVITADVTQIDLPNPEKSGIHHARKILKGIKDISFVELSRNDVVRHSLVQQIIDAYDADIE